VFCERGLETNFAQNLNLTPNFPKPSETQLIVEQVRRFDAITHPGSGEPHDISWLQAGQEFEV
jgi:hypothetical protein